MLRKIVVFSIVLTSGLAVGHANQAVDNYKATMKCADASEMSEVDAILAGKSDSPALSPSRRELTVDEILQGTPQKSKTKKQTKQKSEKSEVDLILER